MQIYLFRILTITVLMALQACVGVQTFPGAARGGSTITLALGSLEGATESNLTITFTPDLAPSTPVNITGSIRSVFNIYPDKTSRLNLISIDAFDSANGLVNWSGHPVWLTVAVLDLPVGLPLGSGNITVSTGAGVVPVNNSTLVDDVSIAIEILPDVDPGDGSASIPGTPDPFEFMGSRFSPVKLGDLNQLKPLKKVVVRSPFASGIYTGGGSIRVYAAEFVMNVPLTFIGSPAIPAPDTALMVIYEDNIRDYVQTAGANGVDGSIAAQTQMSWSRNGDQVTVMLISPTGQLVDKVIRFSIVPYSLGTYDFASTPTVTSVRYFDENGVQIPGGMQPQVMEVNF